MISNQITSMIFEDIDRVKKLGYTLIPEQIATKYRIDFQDAVKIVKQYKIPRTQIQPKPIKEQTEADRSLFERISKEIANDPD